VYRKRESFDPITTLCAYSTCFLWKWHTLANVRKAFGNISGNLFIDTSISDLVAFTVNSSALANHHCRTLLRYAVQKINIISHSDVSSKSHMCLCSRVSISGTTCCTKAMHVQIFVNTVNTSNWYSYFRWYLLDTLSSVTLHNIVHTVNAFVICRNWLSSSARIAIDIHTFMPLVNTCFLHGRLTARSLK
jgi:hypothetical protein